MGFLSVTHVRDQSVTYVTFLPGGTGTLTGTGTGTGTGCMSLSAFRKYLKLLVAMVNFYSVCVLC